MTTQAIHMGFGARTADERRFFLILAIVMAVTNVFGFSLQWVMGRSTFMAPPLVHAHAAVFFGWIGLFVTQSALAARGSMALHRRLGWLAAGWTVVMVVLGIALTIAMVRSGRVPFFFMPGYFLVMNPMTVLVFAGFVTAAIALRRRTQWHRRLMIVAMTAIMGPAFGRILPAPLMIPYAAWGIFAAMMIFPAVGMIRDWRRDGRVHPAWWWGVGALIAMQLAIGPLAESGMGRALYAVATDGTPGHMIDPLAYPPFP